MINDEDRVVLAKDITGCENCPLYGKDCARNGSTPSGMSIDPPCASWKETDEIYAGMYD